MLYKDSDFTVPAFEPARGLPTFTNPLVFDMPDPSVTYDRETGWYYALRPRFDENGKGVSICRSKTLTKLLDESRMVFYINESMGLYDCAWASELHRIGERWYIYAAATCHPTQG